MKHQTYTIWIRQFVEDGRPCGNWKPMLELESIGLERAMGAITLARAGYFSRFGFQIRHDQTGASVEEVLPVKVHVR